MVADCAFKTLDIFKLRVMSLRGEFLVCGLPVWPANTRRQLTHWRSACVVFYSREVQQTGFWGMLERLPKSALRHPAFAYETGKWHVCDNMCSWIKCACLYFHSVVGCHRPPVPTHGSTEGLFHHSGARITFRCDPGFELRGFRTAICLSDGTWSASAPECGKIMMWIVFFCQIIRIQDLRKSCVCHLLVPGCHTYHPADGADCGKRTICFFWKPNFLSSFQCQWKEYVLYLPSQHMGTTSWFMDPMMSSSLCSTCATTPMSSVGIPRERASLTTPGVGLLLSAPKVRQSFLNNGD